MKFKSILKLNLAAIVAAGFFSLTSCSDSNKNYWDLPDNPENPDTPDTPKELKPRYIWVDAAANFPDFANSIENITRDLTLAKNAGFTDIVVDVRPTTGDVLFKSSHCDQVKSLNAWVKGQGLVAIYRTATWDYLQAFIDEGHKLGLRIHAGFNTMVGGHSTGGDKAPAGILFRDASKKDWANWRYNAGRPANVMDLGDQDKFFNPGNPEVQDYVCSLLKDLAVYDIDGIVLDRGRYNDLHSDFSPLSRQQYEAYINAKVQKWPQDIFPEGTTSSVLGTGYTNYTKTWLEFRAKTIYEFMEKCRNAVKSVKPDLKFGVYVGGWYNSYYGTGVNWASKKYNPYGKQSWASERYKNFGYAELMDQILIGAYASPKSVYGTNEWSMQGFCSQAKAKIGNACPIVAGGPDVGNPGTEWDWTTDGAVNSKSMILETVTNSVDACINACDGYFLFDMIHLKLNPEKWDAAKKGIDTYISKNSNAK